MEVFDKLHKQLEQEEWPQVYLFKFIVPNTSEHVAQVFALFEDEANMSSQPSQNDKYVSISAKIMMLDANSVIEKYKEATKIKGLIAL
ncbi:MAG: DUF493 domain-containing protein [Crocinitomicaceae bacterium]|nr:DUF493 domain-containing protein [Crocinitomicaceae bacterium]